MLSVNVLVLCLVAGGLIGRPGSRFFHGRATF